MIRRMPELIRSINAVFKYCNVQEGERVVVFSDSRRARDLADLFTGLASGIGCDATQVWGETRRELEPPSRAAIDAMKSADIVFDLAAPWLYTDATVEIIGTGRVRMLQVLPPESMLLERPPDPLVIKRAKMVKPLFDDSPTQRIHITSPLGTDLTATFKGRAVNPQDGAVAKAGEWDSQGMGFVNCFPIEDSTEGTIVLNGPIHLIGGGNDIIPAEPITVTIREGRAVKITGGAEARIFDQWFDSFGTDNARVVAHLGIGYDHRNGPVPKPVESGDIGSWESMNGGVVVAFGANLGRSGGRNAAPNHCDAVVIGATYTLDGRDLVRNGECLLDSITA